MWENTTGHKANNYWIPSYEFANQARNNEGLLSGSYYERKRQRYYDLLLIWYHPSPLSCSGPCSGKGCSLRDIKHVALAFGSNALAAVTWGSCRSLLSYSSTSTDLQVWGSERPWSNPIVHRAVEPTHKCSIFRVGDARSCAFCKVLQAALNKSPGYPEQRPARCELVLRLAASPSPSDPSQSSQPHLCPRGSLSCKLQWMTGHSAPPTREKAGPRVPGLQLLFVADSDNRLRLRRRITRGYTTLLGPVNTQWLARPGARSFSPCPSSGPLRKAISGSELTEGLTVSSAANAPQFNPSVCPKPFLPLPYTVTRRPTYC